MARTLSVFGSLKVGSALWVKSTGALQQTMPVAMDSKTRVSGRRDMVEVSDSVSTRRLGVTSVTYYVSVVRTCY